MARWRLTAKHYLNVPGTEWEYKEQDRETMEETRHRMTVPRLLDPEDRATRKNGDGHVIVCYADSKLAATDYVFVGFPTPDMEPLDEEAQELSEAELARGQHPMDGLPSQGYQDDILARLTKALEAMGGAQPQNHSLAGVSTEQFAALQEQVQALMEQNAQMQAQLLEQQGA